MIVDKSELMSLTNFVPANFGKWNELMQDQDNPTILVNEYGEFYDKSKNRYHKGTIVSRKRYLLIIFPTLKDKKKLIPFYVHYIVACTFLGLPNNPKLEVNHKDGNRLNNYYENLEWITHQENIKHAVRTGLMPITGAAKPRRKCKAQDIVSGEWIYADSLAELGEKLGISYKAIFSALNRENNIYSNWRFYYND